MDDQLIFEIWDTFRDHIPEKGREAAANQFVDFLVNQDVEEEVFEGLLGYDSQLDDAINAMLDEIRDADDSENYDNEEEDEDY